MTERRDHKVIPKNTSLSIDMHGLRLCSIVVLEAGADNNVVTINHDDPADTNFLTLAPTVARDFGFLGIVFREEKIKVTTGTKVSVMLTFG